MDKGSGKVFQHAQFQLLKRILRPGVLLYNHSLDRFGQNKEEIVEEWDAIIKELHPVIIVMDMPLLDTTQYKDSMGKSVCSIIAAYFLGRYHFI